LFPNNGKGDLTGMTPLEEQPYPLVDLALARRLEETEGMGNAKFVETRARILPDSRAEWIEVAGAYAMFDGPTSPLTQTFGLGLFDPVGTTELDILEDFFKERSAPVFHEISPLADMALVNLLNERIYQPIEFSSVMYRPIRPDFQVTGSRNERITVRQIHKGEENLWARTAAHGWSEHGDFTTLMSDVSQVNVRRDDAFLFLAELDGTAIAAGAMSIFDGVALLAGASTVAEGRNQGAQRALLVSRLRFGSQKGCDLAMMCAQPGSGSQRNAERHGFRIAYTRIKWQLSVKNG
jgi:hypothetical protein